MSKFSRWPQSNLPIYTTSVDNGYLFYSPGYLLYSREDDFETSFASTHVQQLFASAQSANQQWEHNNRIKFQPVSLHIYLTRKCNLSCSYCFSTPHAANKEYLQTSTSAILAAARLVICHCKDKNLPMTLVCHGGGEPTQDKRLKSIIEKIQSLCSNNDIRLYAYLATNGIFGKDLACWICDTFDLVGLSCDGHPQIQDRQRPTLCGTQSSAILEKTVDIFHHLNQPFEVRVTLTDTSWQLLPEIAQYLIKTIRPQQINIELAYLTSRESLTSSQHNEYIKLYLCAKKMCEESGIRWQTSTIRPGQIHARYCHLLDNTFQIIPGEAASTCFLDNDVEESQTRDTIVAKYFHQNDQWILSKEQIMTLSSQLILTPEYCNDCLLYYHCSRGCPELCPLQDVQYDLENHCALNIQLFTTLLQSYKDDLREKCNQHHLTVFGRKISSC